MAVFGNPISDGTYVMFVVQMPDGTQTRLPALSIDGIASVELPPSAVVGQASIVAVCQGRRSMPFTIDFVFRAQE